MKVSKDSLASWTCSGGPSRMILSRSELNSTWTWNEGGRDGGKKWNNSLLNLVGDQTEVLPALNRPVHSVVHYGIL